MKIFILAIVAAGILSAAQGIELLIIFVYNLVCDFLALHANWLLEFNASYDVEALLDFAYCTAQPRSSYSYFLWGGRIYVNLVPTLPSFIEKLGRT